MRMPVASFGLAAMSRVEVSQPKATLEPLMTPAQVCAVLVIKKSTLYAWVQRGKIPCVYVGGRLRFEPSGILRWIETHRSQ